mmetsp:Transcript_43066/g.135745  ORF Transcript_43066/g.135745 Transcript_43066/m.135745 type:complete len:580 (+) Transcript_43066:146-1885(+)
MNLWHGLVALLSGLGLLALSGLSFPKKIDNLLTRAISGEHLFENAAEREKAVFVGRGPAFITDAAQAFRFEGGGKPGSGAWLEQKCEKMKPLAECHKKCGHDHACHMQCPLPECRRMRQKVEETLQCHEKCAGDATCHHDCPRPFETLRSECEALGCRKACGADEKCHEACPKQLEHHHEEPGAFGEHGEGTHRWFEAMRGMWACKTKCGADAACAEQCPKPWTVIQEKCDKAKPIIDCHTQCRHDHACHVKCPMPEEPRWKDMMEQTLKCHGECGSDTECHHGCRNPVAWARDKCAKFEKVHACHQACTHGDFECHRACPGMFDWHHEGLSDWHQHGEQWHQHQHGEQWHQYGEHKEAMGKRHGDDEEDNEHHGQHHHYGEDDKDEDERKEHHGHHQGEHHHGDDDKEHQEHHHNGHHHRHHGKAEGEEERDGDKEREDHGKQRWIESMKARMECKEKCVEDEACIEQCPKPWVAMQEKCDKMTPIVKCHMHCGRDHACHEQCPMPECPKMKEKIEETMKCHGKCGSDFSCHRACPRPLMFVRENCEKFGKVHECHTACAHGDHACHGACPKMYEINV